MEYEIQRLTEHRGAPRFYKQGRRLALSGFIPGALFRAEVVKEKGMVVLSVDSLGDRTVSHKLQGERPVPVVDINSAEILRLFEGMDQIRVIIQKGKIYLMALATEARRRERLEQAAEIMAKGQPLSVGSVSHGAGILSHAIHFGLKKAGVQSRLLFANDIEGAYLNQAQAANDIWSEDTIKVTAPLQEFAMDSWMTGKIGSCQILEGGIPCSASSFAGRAKKHLTKPEDDPNAGHLIIGFLSLIARLNPLVVVLENVESYRDTASMAIYRSQMRDAGYEVHERILEGAQFGTLENRKRMAAVAVTRGVEFNFDDLRIPEAVSQRVADILDPVADDDPAWSPMQYLKDKEVRVPDSTEKYTCVGFGFETFIYKSPQASKSMIGRCADLPATRPHGAAVKRGGRRGVAASALGSIH